MISRKREISRAYVFNSPLMLASSGCPSSLHPSEPKASDMASRFSKPWPDWPRPARRLVLMDLVVRTSNIFAVHTIPVTLNDMSDEFSLGDHF
jgi:hypothetical protein